MSCFIIGGEGGGGAGKCCAHIYREDEPALAQAREGLAGARRRKGRQP
jgi:hypothetical protein